MYKNIKIRLLKLLNVILMLVPFYFCWHLYYIYKISYSAFDLNWLVMVVFIVLYTIVTRVYDAFLISILRITEMIYSQVLAVAVSDFVMYLIICLLCSSFTNLLPGLLCFASQILLITLWCYLVHKWYFKINPAKKTLVVFDVREGLENLFASYGLENKFVVSNTISIEECLNDISIIDEYETIFLSGIHSHERNIVLKYCIANKKELYLIPRIGDVLMSGAEAMHMFHLPMLRVERYNPEFEYVVIKRFLDIVVSFTALVIFSPIIIITSIAIKMEDHGPVFYKQTRLTKDHKEFEIIKFRSMRVDAEKDGVARWSTGENDSRITKVGRVIRKYRIDEIPQLFNILAGDLSLCGPRPERPVLHDEFCKEMPEFDLRLQAKAGLTGYAQVYGKYNTTPYDKLQMDLMYIAHPSIWEDFRIMMATIKILFMPESTEGVEEGKITS